MGRPKSREFRMAHGETARMSPARIRPAEGKALRPFFHRSHAARSGAHNKNSPRPSAAVPLQIPMRKAHLAPPPFHNFNANHTAQAESKMQVPSARSRVDQKRWPG